jgi:hypothetical protein
MTGRNDARTHRERCGHRPAGGGVIDRRRDPRFPDRPRGSEPPVSQQLVEGDGEVADPPAAACLPFLPTLKRALAALAAGLPSLR